MKIIKVMNNNVVFVQEEDGTELVVTGKGIGFQASPGMEVNPAKIEQRYVLQEQMSNKTEQLLQNISMEDLQIARETKEFAEMKLKKAFPDQLLFELVDHMVFAQERFLNGIVFSNALLWEIRHFYPQEFQAGLFALERIKEIKRIEMPEDEAAFIAIHLVNAQSDSGLPIAEKAAQILQFASKLVHYSYGIVLDEDSLSYTRFVIHLKFCLERMFEGHMLSDEDPVFLEMIRTRYQKAYDVSKRLADYILHLTSIQLTEAEIAYLTIHIQRIAS